MKFDLITTMQGDWQVHKHGCRDVPRVPANAVWYDMEAASAQDLVKKELEDELKDMGYSEEDFRIMPCAK